MCVVWLLAFGEGVWEKNGLLEEVCFPGVLGPGWVEVGKVDPICCVFHEVEVSCEDGGVSGLWPDFATNFAMEGTPFQAVVVSGLVVDIDDLESPEG